MSPQTLPALFPLADATYAAERVLVCLALQLSTRRSCWCTTRCGHAASSGAPPSCLTAPHSSKRCANQDAGRHVGFQSDAEKSASGAIGERVGARISSLTFVRDVSQSMDMLAKLKPQYNVSYPTDRLVIAHMLRQRHKFPALMPHACMAASICMHYCAALSGVWKAAKVAAKNHRFCLLRAEARCGSMYNSRRTTVSFIMCQEAAKPTSFLCDQRHDAEARALRDGLLLGVRDARP